MAKKMKSEAQKNEENITHLLNGMSGWMECCIKNEMTLEQFLEKFNKYKQEREEGINERKKASNT